MAGRPKKFADVETLQEAIDVYFKLCDPHIVDVEVIEYPKKKVTRGRQEWDEPDEDAEPEIKIKRKISKQIPYTVAGLAAELDTTRETLSDYEEGKYDLKAGDEGYDPDADQFSDTIKKAKAKILAQKEIRLLTNEVNPAAGIFDLKVNHGYNEQARDPDDPADVREIKLTINYADTPALPDQTRVQVPNTAAPAHQEAIDAEVIDQEPDDTPELLYADDPEPVIRVITPVEV